MSVNAEVLLNAKVTQSSAADNATATATVAAIGGMTHGILGVHADYSAAPAAGFKTITLKKGTTTLLVLRHDFSTGPAFYPLPAAVWGDFGGAVSAELQASGTGGVTGRIALFTFSK
jgi:hypothetical protein